MRAIILSGLTSVTAGMLFAAAAFAAPVGKLPPNDIQATFFTGQPFTATTPSNVKFKMTFTADGKMKRHPIGTGSSGRRDLEAIEGRLLHHLEGRLGPLLHCCRRRQQQMVGAQGLDHHGDLEQIELPTSSLRGAERRSNPGSFQSPECFATLAMTGPSASTDHGSSDARPRADSPGPSRSAKSRSAWRGRRS